MQLVEIYWLDRCNFIYLDRLTRGESLSLWLEENEKGNENSYWWANQRSYHAQPNSGKKSGPQRINPKWRRYTILIDLIAKLS